MATKCGHITRSKTRPTSLSGRFERNGVATKCGHFGRRQSVAPASLYVKMKRGKAKLVKVIGMEDRWLAIVGFRDSEAAFNYLATVAHLSIIPDLKDFDATDIATSLRGSADQFCICPRKK